jgi:hypothetical protein
MIEPFHDHHTYIDAGSINRVFQGNRVGTDRLLKGDADEFRRKTMPALWAITNRLYITTPFRDFCNSPAFPQGQVQYAHVDDRIGNLRITAFACKPRFAPGVKALESALDEIFSDPGLHGLVIDIRMLFGGQDGYGLVIASRLATQKYWRTPNSRTPTLPIETDGRREIRYDPSKADLPLSVVHSETERNCESISRQSCAESLPPSVLIQKGMNERMNE